MQTASADSGQIGDRQAAEVGAFFAQEQYAIEITGPVPTIEERPIAIHLAQNIALSLRLEDLPLAAGGVVVLQPRSFLGGAFAKDDLWLRDPRPVVAADVATMIGALTRYRTLCGFVGQYGGTILHGQMLAQVGTVTQAITVEIGVSEGGFQAEARSVCAAGDPCVSWPDKHCRDTKTTTGRCFAVRCGFTAGDVVGGVAGGVVPIPGAGTVVGGAVDAVGGTGFIAKGRCNEVEVWLLGISLGCQCKFL